MQRIQWKQISKYHYRCMSYFISLKCWGKQNWSNEHHKKFISNLTIAIVKYYLFLSIFWEFLVLVQGPRLLASILEPRLIRVGKHTIIIYYTITQTTWTKCNIVIFLLLRSAAECSNARAVFIINNNIHHQARASICRQTPNAPPPSSAYIDYVTIRDGGGVPGAALSW